MKKVTLVTGGKGFIGKHLVAALVKNNRKVRCLVHWQSSESDLSWPEVEYVQGDLLDRQTLERALEGVDVVYHLAAKIRPAACLEKDQGMYTAVNVEGTRNLAEICCRQGIRKFIYFSSIAAVGPGKDIDEQTLPAPLTAYGKSKMASERVLMSYFHERAFPVTIIRPGLVYGPGGAALQLVGRIVKSGLVPVIGHGTNLVPLCFVSDVVKSAMAAEENGRNGSVYFIVEKSYTTVAIIDAVSKAMGKSPFKAHFPVGLVKIGVGFKEHIERIGQVQFSPFKIDFSRGVLMTITQDWVCRNDKALRELGIVFDGRFEENVASTVRWYQENGML